jgi:hypothetical protein
MSLYPQAPVLHRNVKAGRRTSARRLLVSLMVGALLAPAAAHAQWTRFRRVEGPDWYRWNGIEIAMARDGGALVAWSSRPAVGGPAEVKARQIDPAGNMGPIRVLSDDLSTKPTRISAALDDDGDALVGWDSVQPGIENVWVRRLSDDGVMGPLTRVSDGTDDSTWPAVAVTPGGRGAVSFTVNSHRLLYPISRRSEVGNPIPVALPQDAASLTATRGGDFLTASESQGTLTSDVVAWRIRPDGEVVSQTVSPATPESGKGFVEVGTDRAGNAYITYITDDYDGTYDPVWWSRRWARDGSLGPVRRVSRRGEHVVQMAAWTDLQGDTLLTWSSPDGPNMYSLYNRVWRQNASLGPIHALGHIQANGVRLAIDDDGDGQMTWATEPEYDHFVTWTRRIHPDGSVGPKMMLRDMATPGAVGVTPNGRARIAVAPPDRGLLLTTGP